MLHGNRSSARWSLGTYRLGQPLNNLTARYAGSDLTSTSLPRCCKTSFNFILSVQEKQKEEWDIALRSSDYPACPGPWAAALP